MQLPAWTKKQKILLASLIGAALLCVLAWIVACSLRGAAETIRLDDEPEIYTVEYDDTVDSAWKIVRSTGLPAAMSNR